MEYPYGIIFIIIYFNQVNFGSLPNNRLQMILLDLLILIYVYYHLLILYSIIKYYHMMFPIYLNLKYLNILFFHFLLLSYIYLSLPDDLVGLNLFLILPILFYYFLSDFYFSTSLFKLSFFNSNFLFYYSKSFLAKFNSSFSKCHLALSFSCSNTIFDLFASDSLYLSSVSFNLFLQFYRSS